MRRTRKWLIWTFFILLFLMVILFIAASIFISNFKPNLEKIMTENIGLESRIDGDISLKVTPGISFIANDLKIISNETYILRINKAEISVDYIDLVKSNINIRALRLDKPQVYIVRDTSGQFNFDEQRLRPESGINKEESHNINLSNLRINNGRLLYIDHEFGDTLLVDGLNLSSKKIGVKGSLSNIEVDKIMFDGNVEIEHIKINMLRGESLKFKIDGRGGKMAILPLDNTYFGGNITGKAILDFNKKPAQLQIQHQIKGFDLGRFGKAVMHESDFKGKLNYTLDITFRSFNWLQAKNSLNGSVIIDGEEITVNGFDINKVLTQFKRSQRFNVVDLGAVFVAGPYGAVFTKGINYAELLSADKGDSTNIKSFVSNWQITNGKANAIDVAFNTEKYRMAMSGELDFVDNRYENVRIALLNTEGCAAISQVIDGPFESPETESISAIGTITGPVSNLWKDLTKPFRRPCTPAYNGSIEHP